MPITDTWTNPGPGGSLDFSAGQVVNDTHLDNIVSNFYHQFGAGGNNPWTAFTPTLTQSGSLAPTVNWCAYAKVGKIALVQFNLTVGAAGSAATAIVLAGLPAAIEPRRVASYAVAGHGLFYDVSVGFFPLIAITDGAARAVFVSHGVTNYFGVTPNFAAASGDVLSGVLEYEVAP